jgi:hypothetical protein
MDRRDQARWALANKAVREQAEKKAQKKGLEEEEKKREEEERPAVALALSQSGGQLRTDISTRLAHDAVQSAMASPIHAALLTQLSQQGKARDISTRYTRLVESAISSALVDCELKNDRRLLSLMALNPDALPPPSLHVFCRAALVTAATDALEPFVLAVLANDAVAAGGSGMEGAAAPAPGSALPFSSALTSNAEYDQLVIATEVASSAVQRQCAQFASAWLTSTEAALREPLKRPPSLADLQRDAAGAWKAAMALPAEAIVVEIPTDADADTGAGAGSGASAGEGAGGAAMVSAGVSELSPPAYPSPSAPLAPSDVAAAAAGQFRGVADGEYFPAPIMFSRASIFPSFAPELRMVEAQPQPHSSPSFAHVVFVASVAAAAAGLGAACAADAEIELQLPPGVARPVQRGDDNV